MGCMKNEKKKYLCVFLCFSFNFCFRNWICGYSNVNLIVNGTGSITATQSNFNVKFLDIDGYRPTISPGSPNTVSVIDDTYATFNISSPTKKNDTVVVTLKVKNESNGVGVRISLNLSNSDSEYFLVTENIADNVLQAGDVTTVTVIVKMLKTPIQNDVSASITARLVVEPIENSTATLGEELEISSPSFADDDWDTIAMRVRNGSDDIYKVGDTKTVTIGGNNYTVRIANKSTNENCGDENTSYSQTAYGFVVEFVDGISRLRMHDNYSIEGGYLATDVYDYLKNTVFDQLPVALQNAIIPTRVISGYGCLSGYNDRYHTCSNPDNNGENYSTTDKLYLLSAYELFGPDLNGKNYYDTFFNKTTQLDYYYQKGVANSSYGLDSGIANLNQTVKKYNGSLSEYWIRTPVGGYYFEYISTAGSLLSIQSSSYRTVAPAFRIG